MGNNYCNVNHTWFIYEWWYYMIADEKYEIINEVKGGSING